MKVIIPTFDYLKDIQEAQGTSCLKDRWLFLKKKYYMSRLFLSFKDFENIKDYYKLVNEYTEYRKRINREAMLIENQVFNIEETITELETINNTKEKIEFLKSTLRDYCRCFVLAGHASSAYYTNFHKGIINELRYYQSVQDTSENKSQKTLSFGWRGGSVKLKELFSKMIASCLIAEDTSEADFMTIFEGKPLNNITSFIVWEKSLVLLAYFIYKLSIANDKIRSDDPHWKIAEHCFLLKNKKPKGLKQSWNNCTKYSGLPKQHQLIDELF